MILKHKRLISFLIITLLTLLGSEIVLSLDPLGLSYYRDLNRAAQSLIPDSSGYTYAPGFHQLSHSGFTMLDDGTRLVPKTNTEALRTLVLLGDSVTFGWGVNDDVTWANTLAQALPDWHIIDAGMPGYNSENVRLTLQRFPTADAFVYLIIGNDMDRTAYPVFNPAAYADNTPWLSLYLGYLMRAFWQPVKNREPERFRKDIEVIAANPRVLLVAFPDQVTAFAKQFDPAIQVIPFYTGRNSYADPHANAVGNQQIEQSIEPLVDSFLQAGS